MIGECIEDVEGRARRITLKANIAKFNFQNPHNKIPGIVTCAYNPRPRRGRTAGPRSLRKASQSIC